MPTGCCPGKKFAPGKDDQAMIGKDQANGRPRPGIEMGPITN